MTDVMGTRAAGGIGSGNVVGQNESGLSKQLKAILTSNAPLLNSPGYVSENDLYYDSNSSSVVAVELQAYFAKDKIVFNSLQTGASPSVYIPSVLFCGQGYWVFELNKDATWPNRALTDVTDYFYTHAGFGFSFIKNVIIYMGASSIASITISGMSNFLYAMACCETESKKEIVMYGAGKPMAAVAGANNSNTLMALPAQNQSFWRVQTYGNYFDANLVGADLIDDNMRICTVPIRTPYSSLAFLDKRLDFDTKLCTQPIQITLETRAASEVIAMGSGIKSQFESFTNSTFQMWQQELSDKSMSIRNELLAMPNFNTALPFQYMSTVQFPINSGSAPVSTTRTRDQIFTVNLTSIINADLTSFLFIVRNSYRIAPTTASAGSLTGSLFNPLYGEELYDIELSLNGQNFFRFDQGIYENVVTSKSLNDLSYIPNSLYQINTSTRAINSLKTRGHFYELNNARLRTIINESRFQNVPRYAQQTFQMRFRINRTKNYEYITGSNMDNFVMDMSYLFNGCLLVGGDGGTTKLITQ